MEGLPAPPFARRILNQGDGTAPRGHYPTLLKPQPKFVRRLVSIGGVSIRDREVRDDPLVFALHTA